MVVAIARNWALGNGISADGLNPTNGFHPLYPLTLGALPYLLEGHALAFGFRANLLITALLSTLALLPFYALARAVSSRPMALAGLAMLALNPFLIRVSVNAMETSLALLLLLLLWWYALVWNPHTLFGAFVIGLLSALAVLARLDNALAVLLLWLALAWHEWKNTGHLRQILSASGLAGILLLPYVIRNLLIFDALTPSSGRALSYMHSFRESFVFGSGLQLMAYQPALNLTWAPAWLLALSLLAFVLVFMTLPDRERSLLVPLMLYGLLLTFYYAYVQMQGQPRYYVAVACVLVLVLCAAMTPFEERRRRRDMELPLGRLRLLAVLVVVALNNVLFVGHLQSVTRAPYLAQPAMYQAARWIAANLPPDARLGAQNSGIFQYYSERVVINLDGKLNHEIIPVLERRELASYLQAQDIDYIVDLAGVGEYIEFYSSSMSKAPPHYELSAPQKLLTYGRLLLARVGLGPPVPLDVRVPQEVTQPFEEVTTVEQRFPLPNDPTNAVVLYRLYPEIGNDAGAAP
jgi:hypothetical protein